MTLTMAHAPMPVPRRRGNPKQASVSARTSHALAALHGAQRDAVSGLHIGTVQIGRQLLRVGVRPGNPNARPLLLFNGIGANLELVSPFLAELPDREVVIFDVPGAGQSPAPTWPYRLFGMAWLTLRLLRRMGYEQVDVMGVSWGGGLAQQFAIQYPARVGKLILAATSMGGATMVPGHPRVLAKMVDPRRYTEPGYMRRIAPDLYGGALRTDPAALKQFTDHARAGDTQGYRYQLLAMMGWSSLPWLWRIRHPTLVMAGNDDPLVPLVNARIHAFLLRDARLHILEDGHLFLLTRARESAQVISEFLA